MSDTRIPAILAGTRFDPAIVVPILRGASAQVLCRFSFNDDSPVIILASAAGKTVLGTEIIILEAFSDDAQLTLGDEDDPQRFMDSTVVNPAEVGSYSGGIAGYEYESNKDLRLTISPGTSIAGRGIVILSMV